jgi:DNA repair protein RadC
MTVRIADLPKHDRPRERLWHRGPDALSQAELLALVLRDGRLGESALELAAALLAEYGSLSVLARATPEELAGRPGMGPAKTASVLAALKLAHYLGAGEPRVIIRRPEDLATIAQRELGNLRRERVLVIVMDAGNRMLRLVTLTDGSVDRSLLPVREVLNAVLRNDGVAFGLAHNHPSGDPTPSAQDLRATTQVEEAARVVGLRFLDHLIVTDVGWTTSKSRVRLWTTTGFPQEQR